MFRKNIEATKESFSIANAWCKETFGISYTSFIYIVFSVSYIVGFIIGIITKKNKKQE